MSANTKHSVGLLIVNDVPDSKAIIDRMKTDMYTMNMLVSVLHNSDADEVKNAVDKLTKLNPSLVEEIIIIIHTKKEPDLGDNKFKCRGEIMDIYTNLLEPLLCVEDFENKLKLIIVGGALCKTEVAPTDSKTKRPKILYGPGRYVCILSSENDKFTTAAVSELVEKKGNMLETLRCLRLIFDCKDTTSQNIRHINIWKAQFTS